MIGRVRIRPFAICTGYFTHSPDEAFKAMFRVRSESARLQIANGLIAGPIAELGLASQYADAIGAARHCRNIRNQYAHCHWSNYENGNLFFVSLEKYVEGHSPLVLHLLWIMQRRWQPFCWHRESVALYLPSLTLYLALEVQQTPLSVAKI